MNIGGNQAVTYAGDQAASQNGGGPYNDPDGRRSCVVIMIRAIRLRNMIIDMNLG